MNSESGAAKSHDRPDVAGAGAPIPGSSIPPPVFRPDPKVSTRVARARYTMLILTVVLVLTALVVLVSYRPRFVTAKQVGADETLPVVPGVSAPVQSLPAAQPTAAPAPTDPLSKTRAAGTAIDRLVQSSSAHWLGAQELLPPGSVDSAGAEAALAALRRASVLADSAAAEMTEAGRQAETIRDIARAPDAGQSAYGISLVYTAADGYLKALMADVRDHRSYLELTAEAYAALLTGDAGEYETKTNAANSYRYRSDDRQRAIKRLADQFAQAERELR